MRAHALTALALVVVAAPPAAAQLLGDVTVNFDHPPGDTATIPAGASVDDVYASLGVTFAASGPGCGAGGIAYATRCQLTGAPSSFPNAVSTCGGGTCADIAEEVNGVVRVTFAFAIEGACVTVFPATPTDRGVMRAYDPSDSLVDERTSDPGVTGVRCVGHPRPKEPGEFHIRRVDFSGYGTTFAAFDDFYFTYVLSAAQPASWGSVKALYR